MRIFSGKYPGFAAMRRKLVLMYEKGPWRQKSGKYLDIFRCKAHNFQPQDQSPKMAFLQKPKTWHAYSQLFVQGRAIRSRPLWQWRRRQKIS